MDSIIIHAGTKTLVLVDISVVLAMFPDLIPTRSAAKKAHVVAQSLFTFWIGDDLSVNTKNQVLFSVKSAFHRSFHQSKLVDK